MGEVIQFGRLHLDRDITAKAVANIVGYRNVWALVRIKGGQLQATHFAHCTVMGPQPLWGLYKITGEYVREAGSRTQIEEMPRFKHHTWRRIPLRFTFDRLLPANRAERLAQASQDIRAAGT